MTTRWIRTLLTSALLLFPSVHSTSPLAGQTLVSVGGGASISKASFSEGGLTVTPESRIGITAGASVTMPLAGSVGLQIGGAYVQKGFSIDHEFFGETFTSTSKINYLEITVLAKPSFSLQETMSREASFHLLAGPALGIKAGCSAELNGESVECSEDGVEPSSLDVGFLGGIGVQLGRIRLDVTYTLGLANAADDAETTVKNRSLAIQAGAIIPVGG
ncbi:MAG: porin family protein [Gemmatimonadota bacterium]|nr:porin family protein [Gemmatimonadota bacterium]MDE2873124.1 porin family protein [Gemmatimonadota bacterium]